MSTDPTQNPFDLVNRLTPEQYQAWLNGARVAPDESPMSTQVAQANRTQQILSARASRDRERVIAAAQAKAAQDQKERERQRDQVLAEEAERRLAALKEQARARWTLPASDFEKAWKDYLYQEMVQEQQASDEARLQRTSAYRAF